MCVETDKQEFTGWPMWEGNVAGTGKPPNRLEEVCGLRARILPIRPE